MKYINFLIVVVALLLSATLVLAGEKPPVGAVPLSEIAKSLEGKGYSPITEISIDDGVWEVEAYKEGQERELKVNPVNGDIISDRLDD